MMLAIVFGCFFMSVGLVGICSTLKQRRDYMVMDIMACALIATMGGAMVVWGLT